MWSIEKRKIHIHYNNLYEINSFCTPFLGNHYDTLSLFDLFAVSQYDLYVHAPVPRGHEIYIFGKPFLGFITTYLVCLIYAWE